MLLTTGSEHHPSLMLLEGGLTVIAIGLAFAWPQAGNSVFQRVERAFGRLASKQVLAIATLVFSTILLRLAILPWIPAPLPFDPNDFSNLLAADTYAHGRLTNPTPAMWIHFEAVHVDMVPTYMSMYFPAEGLALGAGKLLFGTPWFGILCCSALMCAALCWMLQAWLPPGWALLGGFLAVLRLGLFSYWTDTFTGAGSIAALGGALVLGALPRLTRTVRLRYGLLMAVGIVLLLLSRPYEGLLLCVPVAFVLGRWFLRGKNHPTPATLIRTATVPLLLIVAAGAWLGYYDFRVFGKPTTLPYAINRATYAMAPYYVWQSPHPEPHYRHEMMRRFYNDIELTAYQRVHSWSLYPLMSLEKVWAALQFFAGFALIVPVFMFRRVLHDRRVRFLVLCVLILMAGNLIMIYILPHYLAPFTTAFYAIGLQAMRHLRLWKVEGKPVGTALVRFAVVACLLLACLRPFAASIGFGVPEWSSSIWEGTWIGPEHFGVERAQIETQLEQLPDPQLVFVRYEPGHPPGDQWVANDADIDASKVIWAWDMGISENQELAAHYRNRTTWLVDPDISPITLRPYSASDK